MSKSVWNKNFTLLFIISGLIITAFYLLLPIWPLFIEEVIGADRKSVGILMMIFTGSAIVSRPISGFILDTYDKKKLYLYSTLLFILLVFAYYFISSLNYLYLVWGLQGFIWGIATTSSSTIVVDVIPKETRGRGVGIIGLSVPISMAIGSFLSLTIKDKLGYDWVFSLAIAFGLIGTLIILFLKIPKYKSNKHFNLRNLFAYKAIPIALNNFLITLSYSSIVIYISLFAKEINSEHAGIFFLVFSVAIGISRLIGGKLVDKSGPKKNIFAGTLLLTLGFILLYYTNNTLPLLVAALIQGLGFGLVMPTFQVMANNVVSKSDRGAANSTFFIAFDLGVGLGSMLFGYVSELIELRFIYILSACFSALALLIFYYKIYPEYNANLVKE
ncbi:MAG: MFS transporter [Bacteroidales bacterium]|nr:MFS transporter [Bacteroidales bacterium]